MIIAIDGPAGSGKSSTAREVARRTDALYIDTGAMYRAVALLSLQRGVEPESDKFDRLIPQINIKLEQSESGVHVFLNGEDVSERIRSSEVSDMSSRVSKRLDVRNRMVELQRQMADEAMRAGMSVVMEGRDIGTVVFPEAQFKFFLVADPRVRAKRRALQMKEKGLEADQEKLYNELIERDERDATRTHSPLTRAEDAIEIDTSVVSFEEQVENIIAVISGNEVD